MSYQVLARKWRPQRFSQVVGQQHVLSALENGLRENRLHHAYLFSGTRGVGKTSIARLFAKGLNCETGIVADPCGVCANCKAIEEGRFIDLIEIDAASRTKVEDTRELLDNVQYKPTVGRFKVYLIDEVHMLSRSSFNALLKTLEEPPEYVKFLLATTDPQKLPITILSRCLQFHLRALEQSQIRSHLEFILTAEKIPFEPTALEKLAKAAQGSIRDSLSLTDQAIAVSNGHITLSAVSQMLGLIDDHQPLELVQALALADGEKAMAVIQSVAEKGVDWQQFLGDIAETLHQIAMLQLLPHRHDQHSGQNGATAESLSHFLARQLPPEDVQFFYQLMLTGKKELPFAPEQRIGVEMTLLRALAFHPKNADRIINPVISPTATATPAVAMQTVARAGQATSKVSQLREQLQTQQASQLSAQPLVSPHSGETSPAQMQVDQQPANSTQKTTASVPDTAAVPDNGQQAVSSPLNTAAMAISALNKLNANAERKAESHKVDEHNVNEHNVNEKKKSESVVVSHRASHTTPEKENLQARFAKLSRSTSPLSASKKVENRPSQTDEEYRWTWLNPELEHQQETAPKPSEIKQAILQERTPELVNKTIALSSQQDEWCHIISRLSLTGLTRQVALNSYLATQQDGELQLVLKPAMAHLNTPETLEILAQALSQQGLRYQLTLGESDSHKTPLEFRRSIFESLTKEAKEALLIDEKLQLLRTAFDAEIDESTIRAVAD